MTKCLLGGTSLGLLMLVATTSMAQVKLGPSGPEYVSDPDATWSAPPPDVATQYTLSLSPAAEPVPPLSQQLWPRYSDLRPGNAVPIYYRALIHYQNAGGKTNTELWDRFDEWNTIPNRQLPREKLHAILRRYERVFEELENAVYRERCDWDWRMLDLQGTEPIEFLLPEVQEIRSLARLLSLRARLEIGERNFAEAIRTLMTGYRMAVHTATPPTLVNDLVGVAIAQMMSERVLEWIGTPGSPNLYWALSGLPRPLIDLRTAMEYEQSIPFIMFPFLQDAESAQRSPEQWREVVVQSAEALQSIAGNGSKVAQEMALVARVLQGYPQAKQALIAKGMPEQEVDAMPVLQVVAIQQAQIVRFVYQETYKWTLLPFADAEQRMQEVERTLSRRGFFQQRGQLSEILPIASVLLPAFHQALKASVRLESRLAGLRNLEAIRMHLASQDAELPKDLNEVQVVPVPRNPTFNREFPYRNEGQRAVLELPGMSDDVAARTWRIELRVRS